MAKRKVGAPTTYSEKMLSKAREYVDNYREYGDPVPTQAALALELGVNMTTVFDWEHRHEEFAKVIADLRTTQERGLVSGGLGGVFSASITRLMMSKHGYVERKELSGSGGGPLQVAVEYVDAED